jgi:hypothetical protein
MVKAGTLPAPGAHHPHLLLLPLLLQVRPAQRELQLQLQLLPAVLPAAAPFLPSFWVAAEACLLGQGMLQSQGETSDPLPCPAVPALLTLLLGHPPCPRQELQTACVAATAQNLGNLQSPAGLLLVLLVVACLQAEQVSCRAQRHAFRSSSVAGLPQAPCMTVFAGKKHVQMTAYGRHVVL